MEIIIVGHLPFAGCRKSLPLPFLALPLLRNNCPKNKKSPLSASGLKSVTAFVYNCAPRTSLCGVLKNRYPNQKLGVLTAVAPVTIVKLPARIALGVPIELGALIEVLIIVWRFAARELVYFVFRRMTTGFYPAAFFNGSARRANTAGRQNENA
jgi:hypothetical protein